MIARHLLGVRRPALERRLGSRIAIERVIEEHKTSGHDRRERPDGRFSERRGFDGTIG
jgi:hypothetical protein